MRYARWIGAVLFFISLVSCMTTRNSAFVKVDAAVRAADYSAAAASLDGPDSPRFYSEKDQVLRNLDTGLLYHWATATALSTPRLDLAERLMEENYTKSLTNAASSFVLNDYQLEYAGEPYEDLYVNVFKALNYAREGKTDAAFVEIRRMGVKLNLLEDKYQRLASSQNKAKDAKGMVEAGNTSFQNSALARFVGMVLYRADGSLDGAAIEWNALKKAFQDQSQIYDFPVPNLEAMVAPSSKARVSVVAFSGQGPVKRANTLRIQTSSDQIFVSEETEDDQGRLVQLARVVLPFPSAASGVYIKTQLADMQRRTSKVARISVLIDGVAAGDLSLIEKIDNVAIDTFNLTKRPTFFKTVLRSVTKGIAAKVAKDNINRAATGLAGALLSVATDVAVDASEQADLRSTRFLPAQASVGDFEVEPGVHQVTIQYFDRAGTLLKQEALPQRTYTRDGLNLVSSVNLE